MTCAAVALSAKLPLLHPRSRTRAPGRRPLRISCIAPRPDQLRSSSKRSMPWSLTTRARSLPAPGPRYTLSLRDRHRFLEQRVQASDHGDLIHLVGDLLQGLELLQTDQQRVILHEL